MSSKKENRANGSGLEKVIRKNFKKTLKKVLPALNGAKIVSYEVSYSPELDKYKIIITKIKLPGDRIFTKSNSSYYQDNICKNHLLYICDPENNHLAPIKRFKEKHNVSSIKWVN